MPNDSPTKTSGCCGCLAVSFLIGLLAMVVILSLSDSSTKPKTQEEVREAQLKKHFSSWDGSHRGVSKLIKASMNDPDSYEHVETLYRDNGDHLVVKTTFRGKNAFGGKVINWVRAKVDLDGNVLLVIEQGP